MKDPQKFWQERIQRAKKKREEWAKEFRTDEGWAYYDGKNNPGYPAAEWININKIYSHLQAQLPMLYSIDPYFYVKLKKSFQPDKERIQEYEMKGKSRQAMLNYLKAELDLKNKARMAILDAHFEYGVAKTRRAADSKEHPKAGQPMLDEEGQELLDETGQPLVYPDTVPVNERYEILWVDACDFLWDEDAGPLPDSWSWCAQHIQMKKSEALKDPRFNKKAVKSIKAKSKADKEDKGIVSGLVSLFSFDKQEKDDNEVIDIYEIYNIKKKEWLFYGEDAEDLLMDERTTPKGIEKHPFSVLVFSKRKKTPYPIPPVFNALDPQKEFSLSRSRLLTHRKRFNRKYEVVEQMLADQSEMSKLESGEDGTIIRVQAIGAVKPIQDAPLDQQNLQELAMLNNDLVEVFGTPAAARGVADADSATEASILDKRLEIREGDRISMVKDFVIDIAKKLDQLIQCHIDREEAVKVMGPQGEFWATVKPEDYQDIEGEYEYSVNLGASQPRLPEIERAQWIAFMSQVVVPFPHILTSPTMMKRMAEMFGIEDEAAIEELRQLGIKIMSGMMPMPGGQGGGPSNNPVAAVLGAAMGQGGGNVNGGGNPMVRQ